MTDRTLNEEDLKGMARRVANNAVQSAEIDSKAAVYMGHLFREHIYRHALEMLKTVVLHERQQAGQPIPDWFKQ